jgi:hypothetical protein
MKKKEKKRREKRGVKGEGNNKIIWKGPETNPHGATALAGVAFTF